MACSACGEQPKNTSKDFTKAVIEINNPETLVLLRKVIIPASMGDESDVPPVVGKYHNVILQYEANKHVYLYSSDGVPTLLETDVPQEVIDRITTLESDVDTLELALSSESDMRERTDEFLQREIDDLKNSPDVVDIVATYADLEAYDTSRLTDKDVIRVLEDETHEGASSYYRWDLPNSEWNFIGTIGSYYTKSETDDLLDAKQDELTPGENIAITDESGELVISAQDTTYTAGYGLELSGTEFSVDSTVIQDTLTAGENISIEDESGDLVISAIDTTYTAGNGLALSGTEFQANTSVLATQTDLSNEAQTRANADTALGNRVSTIEGEIPNAASSSNQLADKNFVNSSIGTNTADYISNNGEPFTSVAQLEAYSGTVTNNDYAFVTGTDAAGNTYYDRYKATVSGSTVTWAKEYRLNNSSFTSDQWAAINSGITSNNVTKLTGLAEIKSIGANLTLNSSTGELSATVPAQVNADWNASSGVAQILNKPASLKHVGTGHVGYSVSSNLHPYALYLGNDTVGDSKYCYIRHEGHDTVTHAYVGGYTQEPDAGWWAEAELALKADIPSAGEARELTSADYNWPTNSPDGIALWELPKGLYYTGPNVKKYISTSRSVESSRTILIGVQNDTNSSIYLLADGSSSLYKFMERYIVNYTTGAEGAIYTYALTDKDIVDNLTSTDTTKGLSANQGRTLNTNIGDLTSLTTTTKASTVAAINELCLALGGKQDELTAGTGITIAEESGALVISSTGGGADVFTTNEWDALWA